MKKLKRMLLIHWHHYEMEMIEFEMINFLTGKTAAGNKNGSFAFPVAKELH